MTENISNLGVQYMEQHAVTRGVSKSWNKIVDVRMPTLPLNLRGEKARKICYEVERGGRHKSGPSHPPGMQLVLVLPYYATLPIPKIACFLCHLHPGCHLPTGISHDARRRVIIRDESLIPTQYFGRLLSFRKKKQDFSSLWQAFYTGDVKKYLLLSQ